MSTTPPTVGLSDPYAGLPPAAQDELYQRLGAAAKDAIAVVTAAPAQAPFRVSLLVQGESPVPVLHQVVPVSKAKALAFLKTLLACHPRRKAVRARKASKAPSRASAGG